MLRAVYLVRLCSRQLSRRTQIRSQTHLIQANFLPSLSHLSEITACQTILELALLVSIPKGIKVSGVIVSELCERFSHFEAFESLASWCARHNVPGIQGVDTRALTTILRNQGSTLGAILVGDAVSYTHLRAHET